MTRGLCRRRVGGRGALVRDGCLSLSLTGAGVLLTLARAGIPAASPTRLSPPRWWRGADDHATTAGSLGRRVDPERMRWTSSTRSFDMLSSSMEARGVCVACCKSGGTESVCEHVQNAPHGGHARLSHCSPGPRQQHRGCMHRQLPLPTSSLTAAARIGRFGNHDASPFRPSCSPFTPHGAQARFSGLPACSPPHAQPDRGSGVRNA